MEVTIIIGVLLAVGWLILNNLHKKCPYCKSSEVSEKFLDPTTRTYSRRCNKCGKQFMA